MDKKEKDDKAVETREETRKMAVMEEQGRMVKDLGDIEGIVEKEASEKHGAEVFYFEPIYRKAKSMRDKLLTDLEIESGL